MSRLAAHDLTCLRGPRLVFEHLDFSLADGDALLLTGPNGSGKSSLIRVLAGLIEPLAGSVLLDGEPMSADRHAARMRIAYLGHLDPVKPTLTVRETLTFWASMAETDAPAGPRVEAAMEALALSDLAMTPGAILSSGQRRRLSLARVLVGTADIWLLDEPTVGLDTRAVGLVEAAVAAHRARGGVAVLSTHIEFGLPGAQTLDLGDYAPAAFAGPAEAAE
jgi:heme exporter protein A